jgi:hypothetical protein
LVSLIFIGAFVLGLTLKHYNTTGRFIITDLVKLMTSGTSKVDVRVK